MHSAPVQGQVRRRLDGGKVANLHMLSVEGKALVFGYNLPIKIGKTDVQLRFLFAISADF